jgi:uncharacterized membrane protein
VKKRALLLLLLSFLGLIDTLYLGLKHGKTVPCSITNGCEEVLNSRFSELWGIPISWFGFAFYFSVLSAAVYSSFGDDDRLLNLIFWPALAGFLISVGLVGVQAFILHAYCQYCLGSAILVTLILAASPKPLLGRAPQQI